MATATGSIAHYDVREYFSLAECGLLSPDDRVELLDGLVVAMAPQAPLHAWAVRHIHELLLRTLAPGTVVRAQFPFIAGPRSVPEPDIAVVPGTAADYRVRHPTRALLVIEVADSSLAQDRLTKARIYAAAAVPTYWLVNLRDGSVECFLEPETATASYTMTRRLEGDALLPAPSIPGLTVTANDLLPRE